MGWTLVQGSPGPQTQLSALCCSTRFLNYCLLLMVLQTMRFDSLISQISLYSLCLKPITTVSSIRPGGQRLWYPSNSPRCHVLWTSGTALFWPHSQRHPSLPPSSQPQNKVTRERAEGSIGEGAFGPNTTPLPPTGQDVWMLISTQTPQRRPPLHPLHVPHHPHPRAGSNL